MVDVKTAGDANAETENGEESKSTGRPNAQPKAGQKAKDSLADADVGPAIRPETAFPPPQEGVAPPQEPGNKGIAPRSVDYLVSIRSGSSLNPAARTVSVFDALRAMPDVEIVRTIKPSGPGLFAAGIDGQSSDVHVIRTTPERAASLQASAAATPDVIVEPNHRLIHLADFVPQLAVTPTSLPLAAANTTTLQFKVIDEKGQPLEKASVMLWGSGFPVQAATDAKGLASINFSGALNTAQALYVKPFANCWEKWVWNPALSDRQINTVSLQRLSSFQPAAFSGSTFLGWGQRLMGLDQKSIATLTGAGVRVAIVDSGCDSSHPDLTHIRIGRDYTNLDAAGNPSTQTWTTDTVSHGTHCAGVIAGNGTSGIRGFAPAAEIHILKLFEGGAFDSLIRSLQYAIDNQIDVVNCSLGSDQSSELVQHWMEQARQAGVAVVVAAGNSAGPVQFPGSLPGVLTVSAIGHSGDYPADTYHAQTMIPELVGVNGIFAAKFTCFGPQVKVCGPGVAIISSVPGGGYAAWDGTSMAAPHLTGLTALVAAHHPAFVNKSAPRNAARVDLLFQTVMAAASSVGLNANYAGVGLSSVTSAVQPSSSAQSMFWQNPATPGDLTNLITQAVIAEIAKAAGAPAFPGRLPGG